MESWGSLVSQPSIISELHARTDPVSKKTTHTKKKPKNKVRMMAS